MVKVQSFGGGVQSVAMLRMAIAGEIERPDLVIFADTMAEPEAVYDVVDREANFAYENGLAFRVVTFDNLAAPTSKDAVYTPLFTSGKGDGQLLRSCTDRFKITPIRQYLRNQGVKKAELWLGMTTDEIERVRPSPRKWITHRYPLIEKNLRRSDCEAYLARLGLSVTKSACVFCPYRSDAAWLQIKANPNDWAYAIAYDERIRHKRASEGLLCFVHSSRRPLSEVVLKNDGAPSLFQEECMGVCNV